MKVPPMTVLTSREFH